MTSIVPCVLGVDPGASGAIAFLFPSYGRVLVEDFPIVNGEIQPVLLAERIRQMGPTQAVVERVGAMPKQGVSSTYKFGVAVGLVHGVIGACQVPLALVTAGRWKQHFRISAEKEEARSLAMRMYPTAAEHLARKKDHGRAEAILIARWWQDMQTC